MTLLEIHKKQKRDLMYVFALLALSVLPRVLIYYFSLYSNEVQGVSPTARLYYEGLRYHIFEYLWYTTNIPPLTHILNSMIFRFFTPEITYGKHIFLIFTFILDVLSVWLLYSAARKFGFYRGISFSIALFYSLTIIPFELWRFGGHYDHHSLFFTSLYIYAISLFFSDKRLRSAALMSLGGGLMIAQSSISSVVVPLTSLLVVVVLGLKLKGRDLTKRIGIVLIVPVAILLLISTKNYLLAGTFATSTKSGPAMMMFVRSALKNDNSEIRKILREANVPDWYLHCFDNSVTPPHVSPDNPNYVGWLALAKDFGICFPWSPNYPMDVEADTWPFDFEPLRKYLHEQREFRIEKLVIQDQNDMRYKKYLLAGYSQELSPRWIGIYGQISLQVGKYLLAKRPVTYFQNILRTHNNRYYGEGPNFFRRTLYSYGKPHSLSTLSKPMFGERFFYGITSIYAIAARVTYLLVPMYFIVTACFYFTGKKTHFKHGEALIKENFSVILLISLPVVFVSLIFSSMADIENDRYFVQITPYLTILMGYFLMTFTKLFRQRQNLLKII